MSIGSYLRETKGELKHINWPTRREAISYTIAVIIISVGIAYFLGFFDVFFAMGLSKLLTR